MSNNSDATGYCNESEDEVFGDSVGSITFISNVTIGLIHFVLTIFFITTQILMFISFYKISKEKYSNMVYDLMKHQGVISFIQQLCHLIASIKTIFLINGKQTATVIIGALLEAAYLSSILFILILSLNRCDLMYNLKYFPSIPRKKFYSIAVILCYVYFCIWIVFFLLPNNNMSFYFRYYEWDFVEVECLTSMGYMVEKWAVYILLILSFILYVLTFCKIIYLRSLKQKATYFYTEDIKLIVHLLISYVLIIFMEICWNGIFFNIYKTQFGALIPQILYINVSGANTAFTVFFVRDFRNSIFGTCSSKSIIPISKLRNAQINKIKVMS
uniref:7TM_GPCR_Srx domain-containing protein n=1 Tax=Strongyloides venezuelensis TaxID=75913 RepID=A0A0K0FC55_STRVS